MVDNISLSITVTVLILTKPLIRIVYYANGIHALAEVSLNSHRAKA